MRSPELRRAEEEIPELVRRAAEIHAGYGTGSSIGEVADTATDLSEYVCYLDVRTELVAFEASIVRETLYRFGLDPGASDATDLDEAALRRVASGGRPTNPTNPPWSAAREARVRRQA